MKIIIAWKFGLRDRAANGELKKHYVSNVCEYDDLDSDEKEMLHDAYAEAIGVPVTIDLKELFNHLATFELEHLSCYSIHNALHLKYCWEVDGFLKLDEDEEYGDRWNKLN